ncbi:MAG: OmpA family protein [Dysgonamonadaceae bacterium]|jgi:OOP family OmpA-OmpF porin|nr:OmpA family protein [Dysgonamonadaceae bacterium]
MKRKIVFLLFLLFLTSLLLPLTAQEAGLVADDAASASGASVLDRVSVGVKAGLNFPTMHYSEGGINSYSSAVYAKRLFEIFADISLNEANTLSVRPGFKFLTRGQHISDNGIDYELNAGYTELSVPVTYTFRRVKSVFPYLFAGPELGFARGGNISYADASVPWEDAEEGWDIDVSSANLKSTSLGVYFGGGVKYPVSIGKFPLTLGAEIGYHWGLTDTYGSKEKSGSARALNMQAYEIKGSRTHRGLEVGVTVSVPLSVLKSFKRKPKPAPVPEPAPAPVVVPEPVVVKEEPQKPCYTIEEMKAFIRDGQDIRGKKICAIKQVTFEFGKSALNKNDKVYLDEIVDLMRQNERINVRVNGHTDNVGSEKFNLNLSQNRAKAVYNYLVGKGIAASRLSYEYFGQNSPIASNDTDEGRAINRRVEFEIVEQ